jgi:peptidoglycan biosynthesis protein MviN/MurJ (putative lipid II flippase)
MRRIIEESSFVSEYFEDIKKQESKKARKQESSIKNCFFVFLLFCCIVVFLLKFFVYNLSYVRIKISIFSTLDT